MFGYTTFRPGQQQVIESYGITETACGCPIRSSMETVVVGQAGRGAIEHVELETEPDFFELFVDGCLFHPIPTAAG